MKADRAALMPDWPARLDAEMAALYLGVSRNTLSEGVTAGRYPHPVREGGRIFWAKAQLDEFVAAQFGMATTARKNTWD